MKLTTKSFKVGDLVIVKQQKDLMTGQRIRLIEYVDDTGIIIRVGPFSPVFDTGVGYDVYFQKKQHVKTLVAGDMIKIS